MGLLDRRRLDDDVVVTPPSAVIGKPALAGPCLADHRDRLVEARGRLLLRHAEAGEMMLDQKHARKPELLGGHHVFDEIVVALAVAGRAAPRPGAAEQSEFHAATPLLRLATIARGGSCQRHSTGANPAARSALRCPSTPSKNRS